jgi:hypothetical protein
MGLLDRFRTKPRGKPDYKNEAVVQRIMAEESVDRATARHWFDEMLVFLDLCAASKHVLSPPEPVDKAWHSFVLHTRDYEDYCNERFGKLVHHQPSEEPDPRAYQRAFKRRNDWSASPDPAVWVYPAIGAGDDGGGHHHDSGGSSCGGGSNCSSGDGGGGSSCGGSSCGGGS